MSTVGRRSFCPVGESIAAQQPSLPKFNLRKTSPGSQPTVHPLGVQYHQGSCDDIAVYAHGPMTLLGCTCLDCTSHFTSSCHFATVALSWLSWKNHVRGIRATVFTICHENSTELYWTPTVTNQEISPMMVPYVASILSTILSIAIDRVEGVIGVCGALASAGLIVGVRRSGG